MNMGRKGSELAVVRNTFCTLYFMQFISGLAFVKGQEVGWKRDPSTCWNISCVPALVPVLEMRWYKNLFQGLLQKYWTVGASTFSFDSDCNKECFPRMTPTKVAE